MPIPVPGHPQMGTSFDAIAPFQDPFADQASVAMPISIPAMLRHAEFFAVADPTLYAAYKRVAAHFLTEIEITGDEVGTDEKKEQKAYLEDTVGVLPFMLEAGLSTLIYGNGYFSVLPQFVRYVVCQNKFKNGRYCGSSWRLQEFQSQPLFKYKWRNGIAGYCPACGFSGVFHDKDRPPRDEVDESAPVILKSWNPHDIRINYNAHTGQTLAFIWVIPAQDRTEIKQGLNPLVIATTPWDWVMAANSDMNLQFTPDYIFHWREPYISGLRFQGVGVSRSIISYRQLYLTRMLLRMNEVLAAGHVVPMRVISPANTAGRSDEGDILRTGHLGNVRARTMQLVANWRQDPSSIGFSPIPLQMQALGADARSLIPADIITQSQDQLLNGLDVPTDYYRCTLTQQNAPVGIRLMEKTWAPFVHSQNRLLKFIGRRCQYILKWTEAQYQFKKTTLVDDLEKSQLKVQMSQAGLVSRTKALDEVGEDFEEQTKQKLRDQMTEQRLQAEMQEEADAFGFAQQLGQQQGMPPGMQPAGPGGQPGQPGAAPVGQDPNAQGAAPAGPGGAQQAAGTPAGSDPLASLVPQNGTEMDPQEFVGRAQQVAKFLITVPEGQRFGMLKQIRETHESFHQMVKGELEKLRSKARSQGQQMVLSQMGAQQGGQPGGQ